MGVYLLSVLLGVTVLGLCAAQAPVEITPQNPVVLEGQNLTVLCRVGVDIHYCRITIPGLRNSLNLKAGQRVGGNEYYGAGLEQGQCGVHIAQVSAREAGEFRCSLGTSPIESEAVTTIIVAREPNPPEMETSPGTQARDTFRFNDILTARCVVRDGRPPANLSWYLDDEPLYEGLSELEVHDTADAGLATSVQNITRRLQPSDDGRRLTCVARHLAYRGDSRQQHQRAIHHIIKVQYEPLPRERPIGIFGVTLGETALINVTIEANPAPRLEWVVSGETVPEGSVDSSQRFEVTSAQPLGGNRYNATLRIADLTLEDTTKDYKLRAGNDIGQTEYEVRISSSEPPMGGILDLGSIVGIVVAIAIILIIVVLIIFARATGRWCFHGSSDNEDVTKTRHVGETSDTESATEGAAQSYKRRWSQRLDSLKEAFVKPTKKEEAAVAMQETTLAPQQLQLELQTAADVEKNENDNDETKPLEGGVVYAELELKPGSGPTIRPMVKVDDEKTEYAEILYVNQDKPK